MSDETRVEGACLCGGVRFSVRLPTLFCTHCHCTMCQRAHGAGYITWFGVSTEALGFASGEDLLVACTIGNRRDVLTVFDRKRLSRSRARTIRDTFFNFDFEGRFGGCTSSKLVLIENPAT